MTVETLENKKYNTKNPVRGVLMRNFSNALEEMISLTGARRIGDVGCGAGHLLAEIRKRRFLRSKEASFYGCDIDFAAVDAARERNPQVPFSVQDVFDSAYRNGSFDLVICTEVLEHLREPQAAIRKLCALSEKWLIFSVPNEPWFGLASLFSGRHLSRLGESPNHVNFWTAWGFASFLGKHFTLRKISYPFPWILVLCEKSNEDAS